jgi:hypothetical protein
MGAPAPAAEQKTPLEIAREKAETTAVETNKTRSGKGTRISVGATRGKNPQVISFEQFDDSQPDTLPGSVKEFMELTTNDEKTLVDYLIRGYNNAAYEAASDPLAEYIPGKWAPEVQSTFRQAVRNYSRGLGIPLEEAVGVIRVGFVNKFGE